MVFVLFVLYEKLDEWKKLMKVLKKYVFMMEVKELNVKEMIDFIVNFVKIE